MHWHSQNLKKEDREKGYLFHGRGWLNFGEARSWMTLGFEWSCPSYMKNLGFEVDLNHYGDTAIGGRISLVLFTFYWSVENRTLYNLLEKITKRRDDTYTNGRTIGFDISPHSISVSLWYDPMESQGSDPWWWHGYWDTQRLLKGKAHYSEQELREDECMIIMPERSYPARFKIYIARWEYPRWFTQTKEMIEFKMVEGIPIPGKGENSWDCGDDAVMGTTKEHRGSLRDAMNEVAMDAMKTRIRHGGSMNWLPKKDEVDAIIYEAEQKAKTKGGGES
jgi:hypothetical protein